MEQSIVDHIKAKIDFKSMLSVKGGASGAGIFILKLEEDIMYLKTKSNDQIYEIESERKAYDWLKNKLRVPKIEFFDSIYNYDMLCVSKLDGILFDDLKDELDNEKFIDLYIRALKNMHSLDISSCKLENKIKKRLSDARKIMNIESEKVVCTVYDYVNGVEKKINKINIYRHLMANIPSTEELVFTHGDYCFDNLIYNDGVPAYIDLGRGGVADKYQDIALAVRNIHEEFGLVWVDYFIKNYGISDIDFRKVNYYILLDELF